MSDAPPEKMSTKLFIGNITYNTGERELLELFGKHGAVKECRVAVDGSTGRSRGYAFITMDSLDEANAAIAAINNMDIDGRQVKVEVSQPKPRPDAIRPYGDRGGGGDRDRRDNGRDRDFGRERNDRGDFGRERREYGRERDGRDRGDFARRDNNFRDDRGGRGGGGGGERGERRDRSRDR